MLYTSIFGSIGPGILWAYAPEAEAIGVGSTGGGPDIPGHPEVPALSWETFSRDLRLARQWCDNLLIHSLEGCVRQGFLTRLRSFDWEEPVEPPKLAPVAKGLRSILRGFLWANAHPRHAAVGVVVILSLLSRRRRAS